MPNFVRDVLGAKPADDRALITLGRDGARREWSFGELLDTVGRFAGVLHEHGVRRGTVVLTLLGNRIEYPLAMLGCL